MTDDIDDRIASWWNRIDGASSWICPVIVVIVFIMFNALQYSSIPRDVDSFYYMNLGSYDESVMHLSGSMLPIVVHESGIDGARLILLVLTLITTMMIYILSYNISRSNIVSTICSVLFFMDPIHVMQYVNVLDKPPLIMFSWIYMIYIMFTVRKPSMIAPMMTLIIPFIYIAWQGYFLFIPLIVILTWCMMNDRITVKGMVLYACSSMVMMHLIDMYYDGALDIVQELRPAWHFFSPFYAIYIGVIIYAVWWHLKHQSNSVLDILVKAARYATDKRYVSEGTVMKLVIIMCFFSVTSFRLMIFFVPVAYLGLAYILKIVIENRRWFSFLGIVSGLMIIIMLSVPAYSQYPVYSENMQLAVEYLNDHSSSRCLMTDWGVGHIYQYYTNKTILDRGHPDMKYLKRLTTLDFQGCDFILSYSDGDKLEHYREILNITSSNEEWKTYNMTVFPDDRYTFFVAGWRG